MGGTVAVSAGFLGQGRTILDGSLEGSSFRFVTKRLVMAGSDHREAVNHYTGTIEGEKIDMVLSIQDAASSHEPVSFMLSRIAEQASGEYGRHIGRRLTVRLSGPKVASAAAGSRRKKWPGGAQDTTLQSH